ncbi:MAG: histone deacetylase [Pseudomonadota bacterium]
MTAPAAGPSPEAFNLFYCDQFVLPLPVEHRFPMSKYSLLRERLRREPRLAAGRFSVPPAASLQALKRVHSEAYLDALISGALPRAIERRIGFPYSEQMVERSRRSVGGTMAAAEAALECGVAVNLAGGTHHAFADTGGGYCVLNDVAVAARYAQTSLGVGQVLVVDLDVHQGDGTAAIFSEDSSVFTFSMHGGKNYPTRKQASDLDVALDDGTDDEAYLKQLEGILPELLRELQPDLVFYLAGADPFAGDRLGRLSLSKTGLAQRDSRVFNFLRTAGVPAAVCMAGGYADSVEDIVSIHTATVLAAHESWRRWQGKPAG